MYLQLPDRYCCAALFNILGKIPYISLCSTETQFKMKKRCRILFPFFNLF